MKAHSVAVLHSTLALVMLAFLGCEPSVSERPARVTATASNATLDVVRTVVAEQFNVDRTRVAGSATIASLGADELDLVELVMELEDRFDIDIPDAAIVGSDTGPSDFSRLLKRITIDDLVRIVDDQRAKPTSAARRPLK